MSGAPVRTEQERRIVYDPRAFAERAKGQPRRPKETPAIPEKGYYLGVYLPEISLRNTPSQYFTDVPSVSATGFLDTLVHSAGNAFGAAVERRLETVTSPFSGLLPYNPSRYGLALPLREDWQSYSNRINGALDAYERMIGRSVTVVHGFQQFFDEKEWEWQYFPNEFCDLVAARGGIPLITWEPWSIPGRNYAHKALLQEIIDSTDDPNDPYNVYRYIFMWAKAAAKYGKPIYLRMMHEMNGTWYPWCGMANGGRTNGPETYIRAWRKIHEIFEKAGATNVNFVWCPNAESIPSNDWNKMGRYYPGDNYVDIIGFSLHKQEQNQSFGLLFREPSEFLATRSVKKPLAFPEYSAGSDFGGAFSENPEFYRDLHNEIQRRIGMGYAFPFAAKFEVIKEQAWQFVWPNNRYDDTERRYFSSLGAFIDTVEKTSCLEGRVGREMSDRGMERYKAELIERSYRDTLQVQRRWSLGKAETAQGVKDTLAWIYVKRRIDFRMANIKLISSRQITVLPLVRKEALNIEMMNHVSLIDIKKMRTIDEVCSGMSVSGDPGALRIGECLRYVEVREKAIDRDAKLIESLMESNTADLSRELLGQIKTLLGIEINKPEEFEQKLKDRHRELSAQKDVLLRMTAVLTELKEENVATVSANDIRSRTIKALTVNMRIASTIREICRSMKGMKSAECIAYLKARRKAVIKKKSSGRHDVLDLAVEDKVIETFIEMAGRGMDTARMEGATAKILGTVKGNLDAGRLILDEAFSNIAKAKRRQIVIKMLNDLIMTPSNSKTYIAALIDLKNIFFYWVTSPTAEKFDIRVEELNPRFRKFYGSEGGLGNIVDRICDEIIKTAGLSIPKLGDESILSQLRSYDFRRRTEYTRPLLYGFSASAMYTKALIALDKYVSDNSPETLKTAVNYLNKVLEFLQAKRYSLSIRSELWRMVVDEDYYQKKSVEFLLGEAEFMGAKDTAGRRKGMEKMQAVLADINLGASYKEDLKKRMIFIILKSLDRAFWPIIIEILSDPATKFDTDNNIFEQVKDQLG